jgi:hypothetical protein
MLETSHNLIKKKAFFVGGCVDHPHIQAFALEE